RPPSPPPPARRRLAAPRLVPRAGCRSSCSLARAPERAQPRRTYPVRAPSETGRAGSSRRTGGSAGVTPGEEAARSGRGRRARVVAPDAQDPRRVRGDRAEVGEAATDLDRPSGPQLPVGAVVAADPAASQVHRDLAGALAQVEHPHVHVSLVLGDEQLRKGPL